MSTIRDRLQELCDGFNSHDLDRIMSLFAEDCVLEMPRGDKPWGNRMEGKDAVRQGLASRFEGLPDVHYGDATHFVDEEANTRTSKWTLTGTFKDGKHIEVWGCDFYTFRDGRALKPKRCGAVIMAADLPCNFCPFGRAPLSGVRSPV